MRRNNFGKTLNWYFRRVKNISTPETAYSSCSLNSNSQCNSIVFQIYLITNLGLLTLNFDNKYDSKAFATQSTSRWHHKESGLRRCCKSIDPTQISNYNYLLGIFMKLTISSRLIEWEFFKKHRTSNSRKGFHILFSRKILYLYFIKSHFAYY